MKLLLSIGLSVFTALFTAQACAQQLIPFQARITNVAGGVVDDGVYSMNFNVYDTATAGTAIWTETHSTVSVSAGVVNVILGSLTPLNDPNKDGNIADAVTFYSTSGDRFIGISIEAGQEMVPRHQLIPSFHAVTADDATKLGGNTPAYYQSVTQHDTDIQDLSQTINTQFTGAIVAFSRSCPTGWILADGLSGTPDLRGRFLRGEVAANPALLDFGGNDDAVVVNHNHSIDPPNTSTAGNGAHTHTIHGGIDNGVGGGANGQVPWAQVGDRFPGWGAHTLKTSTTGSGHSHSVNIRPFISENAGVTGVGGNVPKYYEVIYCIKQ